MTTPTTAEQTEPAIKWAQSLLHHAAFPDPVSMYCAIPAHSVEAAARYLASVERENEDARATIARLEGELQERTEDYHRACSTIAAMHAAAVGEITGPRRGTVEDVEDMRTRADAAERRVEALTGAALAVLDERDRQRTAEGWTDAHDDQHTLGELASAAACYALPIEDKSSGWYAAFWPWAEEWWKPSPNNRRRDLVKAGALILAEIERLDRTALAAASGAADDAATTEVPVHA